MNFDASDIGNGAVFAALNEPRLRYHVHRRIWMSWDGQTWAEDKSQRRVQQAAEEVANALRDLAASITLPAVAPRATDDDGEPLPATPGQEAAEKDLQVRTKARQQAFAWARESRSQARLQAMIRRGEHRLAVTTQELDADPWILACRNGALDLRTGIVAPPVHSQLSTRMAAVEWDPAAKSEAWDAFLRDVTGGDEELQAYLQRAAGYALLGEWREKAFWFAYGPPDGGKSTLLNILAGVLGSYHVSAADQTWMAQNFGGGNRGDLVRLAGARLVTTSEITPGARFDTALMKKVTGGDPIVAAAKYEGEIEFAPSFALWLAGNDRPIITVGDDGLWRRVRCVPFTHSVPLERQDPTLARRLVQGPHASAVLRWAWEGLQAYLDRGLGTCAAVDAANSEYRLDMNPLRDFAEANLLITDSDADTITAADLHARYAEWCYATRQRTQLHTNTFGRALTQLGANAIRVGKARARGYSRVKLTF